MEEVSVSRPNQLLQGNKTTTCRNEKAALYRYRASSVEGIPELQQGILAVDRSTEWMT